MRFTHLRVQAVIVMAMVASVSWPQFRPVRSTHQGVWRYVPAAVLQARTLDAARFAGDAVQSRPSAILDAVHSRPSAILDDATFATPGPAAENPVVNTAPDVSYLTPAAAAVLGGKSNALLGFARTSLNTPIPFARVVLRNIRTGQVFARTTANQRGEFSFVDIESNSYVVELLGADGSVVAASPLVTMGRFQVQETELRVAAAADAVTASLGNTLAPTLQQATAVAASSDVTRTTSMQTAQESPR